MIEYSQPDWLKDYHPTSDNSNASATWKKGMPSPNPAGRPKGIVDRRNKITEVLFDDGPAIVRVVINAALAGDIRAAGLVLSRIAPALKPQSEYVKFNFDANVSLTSQVELIVQAIAEGEVSPDAGKQIIDSIVALGSVRQLDELEARIVSLEGKRR